MRKTGISLIDSTHYTPTVPECRTREDCYACPVQPCAHAVQTHEAVRLLQSGARTSLVCQLTELPKKYIKRLAHLLNGQAPPRGLAPFTDAWFRESEHRMLHASAVWRIHNLVNSFERSKARELLDIYDIYLHATNNPLLDITRIVAVINLVKNKVWEPTQCVHCNKYYLTPVDENLGDTCPGCRLYFRFRCSQCGAALSTSTLGRPRTVCERCATQPTLNNRRSN